MSAETRISKPEVGITIIFASDSGVLCLRRCKIPNFDELRACRHCSDSLATVKPSSLPSVSVDLYYYNIITNGLNEAYNIDYML